MRKLLLILLIFLSLFSGATNYYVAKTGSNDNPGTEAEPWLTITKAVDTAVAGDVIYVRTGSYNERVIPYLHSGSSGSPVTLTKYPGESPIIDGTDLVCGAGGYVVQVWSSYYIIDGFQIVSGQGGSYNSAVGFMGDHGIIKNCTVHDVIGGIYLMEDNCIAEYNEVYNACMDNSYEPGKDGFINSVGISCCEGVDRPLNCIIRHNNVHDVWGEGISTFEANYTTIEDNIVRDSWSCNLYVSDASYSNVQRNFVYSTSNMIGTAGNPIYEGSQIGILFGDEQYNPGSDHNYFYNNIVYNCKKNFDYWGTNDATPAGLISLYVINNTFVDARDDGAGNYRTNVLIGGNGDFTDCRFQNNIVYQRSDANVKAILMSEYTGDPFLFSNNLWYSLIDPYTSEPECEGTGDVVGDPKFTGGDPNNVIYYKLQSGSPAINAGVNVGLTTDFYNHSIVGLPDIGAMETGYVTFYKANNKGVVKNGKRIYKKQ